MRIAHATDIHWMSPPGTRVLNRKRLLGTANLYLRGRRHHFTEDVQSTLVRHILDLQPDLLVITGDLTAQALPTEFEKAATALAPVLEQVPTFVIPGNHDVYTLGARRDARIRAFFGPYMGLRDHSPLTRADVGAATCLGLDPNRPTWIVASGVLPEEQLIALAEELQDPALADRFLVLAIHYPLLDRHGAIYDGRNHGLLNARALIDVLERAPRRPDIILHGHEHHGFHVELELSDATIPIYNCGSSGYAHMPQKRRAAAMNVYTVEPGEPVAVERFLFEDGAFVPEEGGAYATGR